MIYSEVCAEMNAETGEAVLESLARHAQAGPLKQPLQAEPRPFQRRCQISESESVCPLTRRRPATPAAWGLRCGAVVASSGCSQRIRGAAQCGVRLWAWQRGMRVGVTVRQAAEMHDLSSVQRCVPI